MINKFIILCLLFACSTVPVIEKSDSKIGSCDCDFGTNAECNKCEYKSEIEASACTEALCNIKYQKLPQLDCNTQWLDTDSCGQKEADLYCQILNKSPYYKAIAGEFSIQEYDPAYGLWTNNWLNTKGIELTTIPKAVYAQVIYFEQNPYPDTIKVLVLGPKGCFKMP